MKLQLAALIRNDLWRRRWSNLRILPRQSWRGRSLWWRLRWSISVVDMIDSIRQRMSALYRWRLSRLRNLVVGRYGMHYSNLRGLTPFSFAVQKVWNKKKFNTARAANVTCKSFVTGPCFVSQTMPAEARQARLILGSFFSCRISFCSSCLSRDAPSIFDTNRGSRK